MVMKIIKTIISRINNQDTMKTRGGNKAITKENRDKARELLKK
jgi:hypothetical protein